MTEAELVQRIAQSIRGELGHGVTACARAVIADLKLTLVHTHLEEGHTPIVDDGPPTHWRLESGWESCNDGN